MKAFRRAFVTVAVLGVSALVLASCAAATEVSTNPERVDVSIDAADMSRVQLPNGLAGTEVLEPDWVIEPQERDGVFVGPQERDGYLEYVAIDSDGTQLWTARRPLACSGFVLTETAAGQSIAVLTDVHTSDGALAPPTVAAFDLRSGTPVWGPVDVTGPYKGPGLVYAAPPEGFIGDAGEKVALDPSTGEPLLAEAALTEGLEGNRIIGEYRGIVILADSSTVSARTFDADGSHTTLWSLPAEELGWDLTHVSNNTRHSWLGDDHAVLAASPDTIAVVELGTGSVVAEGALETALDPDTGMLIVVDGDSVRGVRGDGEEAWSATAGSAFELTGVGGGTVYARDGSRNVALRAVDGEPAEDVLSELDKGDLVFLPRRPSSTGAAVVQHGQEQLLVTTRPATRAGRRVLQRR